MLRGATRHCASWRPVVLLLSHVCINSWSKPSRYTDQCSSLLLFLIFFPRATPADPHSAKDSETPSLRTAFLVTATCLIHAIFVFILSIYFIRVSPDNLQAWANFLGVFATVLASIQYFPQIYTTYMLKRVGSLSIPMMCIQTPGSFVWAASLSARLGKQGWSAWGVYLVTGCLQGTLLFMAIYFELRERSHRKEEDATIVTSSHQPSGATSESEPASEQTPLLESAQ